MFARITGNFRPVVRVRPADRVIHRAAATHRTRRARDDEIDGVHVTQ